jgi:hypothetical protein
MEIDGLKLTVRRTSRKRIEEVLIAQELGPQPEKEEEGK